MRAARIPRSGGRDRGRRTSRARAGRCHSPAAIPPAASARIAGKLLNRHSAHEVTEAITVLIDVLDLMDGEPDAGESDPLEGNGDECDMSWPVNRRRSRAPPSHAANN